MVGVVACLRVTSSGGTARSAPCGFSRGMTTGHGVLHALFHVNLAVWTWCWYCVHALVTISTVTFGSSAAMGREAIDQDQRAEGQGEKFPATWEPPGRNSRHFQMGRTVARRSWITNSTYRDHFTFTCARTLYHPYHFAAPSRPGRPARTSRVQPMRPSRLGGSHLRTGEDDRSTEGP